MPNYARTDGGIVRELISIPEDGPPIEQRFHPDLVATLVEVPGGVSVSEGWLWNGEQFSPPSPQAPAPLPPLTARQLRLWLLSRDITGAMVTTAIQVLPGQERAVAEIEWEYATEYLRSHPMIDQIGAAFELTPELIDAAWPDAAAL
jgi:hypothetical protein